MSTDKVKIPFLVLTPRRKEVFLQSVLDGFKSKSLNWEPKQLRARSVEQSDIRFSRTPCQHRTSALESQV